MKAKDISSLCESENLSSDQIFDLIHRYLEKKLTSIGMETYGEKSFRIKLVFSEEIDSYSQVKRRSRAYIKEVSQQFGRLYLHKDGGTVNAVLPGAVHRYWKFYPIFYIGTEIILDLFTQPLSISLILTVKYSHPYLEARFKNSLEQYEDFSTDEGQQKVYNLINSITRFIRLNGV